MTLFWIKNKTIFVIGKGKSSHFGCVSKILFGGDALLTARPFLASYLILGPKIWFLGYSFFPVLVPGHFSFLSILGPKIWVLPHFRVQVFTCSGWSWHWILIQFWVAWKKCMTHMCKKWDNIFWYISQKLLNFLRGHRLGRQVKST